MQLAERTSVDERRALRRRTLVISDTAFTARLHARALPSGLFPRLGQRFLRAYHGSFVASPHGVALLVEQEEVPVGFVLGATRQRAHLRWVLRRRGVPLALLGAAGLLRHPALAGSFARRRLRRYARGAVRLVGTGRRRAAAPPSRPEPDPADLTHVAVDPGRRRAGAGAALVIAFGVAVRDAGAETAHLVTLRGDDGAGAFYERLGWHRVVGGADLDGQALSRYRLDLRDGARVA